MSLNRIDLIFESDGPTAALPGLVGFWLKGWVSGWVGIFLCILYVYILLVLALSFHITVAYAR